MLNLQNQKRTGSVINKLRTGNEWTPGQPANRLHHKHEGEQPNQIIVSKAANLLVGCFSRELPPADSIVVVPNSLRRVDQTHNIWVGSVQTVVYFSGIGPRIHVSRVRFCLVEKDNGYSIHHNHIIFI
jgi:hypothetical protein